MANQLLESWKKLVKPVYRPELTILIFGIILTHFFLGGWTDIIVRALSKSAYSKMIFFCYTPIILIISFVTIPAQFTRLARLVFFVSTFYGILTLEMAVFNTVRRPNVFDLFYHGFIIIQALVMLIYFLRGLRDKLDIHEKLLLEMRPSPVMNVLILLWVFAGYYLFQEFPGIKSHQNAEYTFLTGNILIWLGSKIFTPKTAKTDPGQTTYQKKYR